jgi:hypothetical protein
MKKGISRAILITTKAESIREIRKRSLLTKEIGTTTKSLMALELSLKRNPPQRSEDLQETLGRAQRELPILGSRRRLSFWMDQDGVKIVMAYHRKEIPLKSKKPPAACLQE